MKNDTLTGVKQKASYFVIAVVMWEFFSYFGLQAMLILYMTQYLHIDNKTAYQIYGNFTALIFITPILGGILADKFCGYRYAVNLGCLLIISGHIVLSCLNENSLYYGLSLLALGIGLFKSNAICLIGDCYTDNAKGKNSAFSLYYVSGNIGAIVSQLLCPYFAETIGWSFGFFIAALGMFLGFITLMLSRPYFTWQMMQSKNILWTNLSWKNKLIITLMIVLFSFLIIYILMIYSLVGYCLIFSSLVITFLIYDIRKNLTSINIKKLNMVLMLTLFATLFWAVDQQSASSVSIFISVFVERHIGSFAIPAGMFQAINPAVILLMGLFTFKLWNTLERKSIFVSSSQKLNIAMILLVFAFLMLSHSALLAEYQIKSSMLFPIISLILIGSAEMFVDPVLLSEISSITPENIRGRLISIYYFFVGAVANYFAAVIAKFTVGPTGSDVFLYHEFYKKIYLFFVALVLILFFYSKIRKIINFSSREGI